MHLENYELNINKYWDLCMGIIFWLRYLIKGLLITSYTATFIPQAKKHHCIYSDMIGWLDDSQISSPYLVLGYLGYHINIILSKNDLTYLLVSL